ncbi:RidA family protein [Candidatus Parcubacteria bacterium]|nr:RidA family protein [Candidatus Parcubacteria bacterium]
MKKIISTDKAPQAIGPYSQAIETGNLVFCSGQIPLTSEGNLVEEDISEQTKQVMENLKAILQSAGLELDNIVKATIYLTDINNFQTVNKIYGQYFETEPPARAVIQAAALPKGVEIEIEAVAAR